MPGGLALRLFATCELLAAEHARELGVVDEVVSREKLRGKAETLVTKISRAGRDAVTATKTLLRDDPPLRDHERAFGELWTAKVREG